MTVFAVFLLAGFAVPPTAPPPLPMREVEACHVEFTRPETGRWGGQIAIYDVQADAIGKVMNLRRRVIQGREHLPPHVRLDQLESCIRRWAFGAEGDFTVALLGGTTYGGIWIIEVAQPPRSFLLRVPVAVAAR